MKCQGELSIIGAYGGYSKTPAKHAPVVGNSVLNLLINILGSGSVCTSKNNAHSTPAETTQGPRSLQHHVCGINRHYWNICSDGVL